MDMSQLAKSTLVTILLSAPLTQALDHELCQKHVTNLLNNGTLLPDSPFFYRATPNSPPYTSPNNMTLTLQGCRNLCGTGQTWYPDIGPRLNTWVVPVFLLLVNVEISSVGKRNLFELLHLLGDPIDSLWSLIHKIDAWDRCASYAARYQKLCSGCRLIVATVFAGYEEVQGARIMAGRDDLDSFATRYSFWKHFHDWRHAAIQLADGRTDELIRTILTLVLYLYQLTGDFIPAIGGDSSSYPGHRIATSILLSCFVPAILLTNVVGGFASRRSAFHIMNDLALRTIGRPLDVARQYSSRMQDYDLIARVSASDYQRALVWCGGIYMYRPWKTSYITTRRNRFSYTLFCAFVAALPVLAAVLGGSLLLWWQTPRGFDCRHSWLIGIGLLWMISAFITQISHSPKFLTGKYHWRFVLVKDAFVAAPSLIIPFLSTSGLFNSCYCWSGPWEYPGTGRVILPYHKFPESNGKVMYPVTLFATLIFQLLVLGCVIHQWRLGIRLLRWTEKSRREQFARLMGDHNAPRCECFAEPPDVPDQNVLLERSRTASTSYDARVT